MSQQYVLEGDQRRLVLPGDATQHSSARTEHYGLNFWKPSDKFVRTDFNADNLKIDAALKAEADARAALAQTVAEKGNCRIVTGTYIGTGEFGADHPTGIEVPDAERPPWLVAVSDYEGSYKMCVMRGMSMCHVNGPYNVSLIWTDTGLQWYSDEGCMSQLNLSEKYIANPKATIYYYTVLI